MNISLVLQSIKHWGKVTLATFPTVSPVSSLCVNSTALCQMKEQGRLYTNIFLLTNLLTFPAYLLFSEYV